MSLRITSLSPTLDIFIEKSTDQVTISRYGFDTVTRYKHGSPEEAMAALRKEGKQELSIEQLRKEGYIMGVEQWMARILFLGSSSCSYNPCTLRY